MKIEEFVKKYRALLPSRGEDISAEEARNRASDFLYAIALISAERLEISKVIAQIKSLVAVEFEAACDKYSKEEKIKVTEKKIKAEADKEYQSAREELEILESNISFLKTHEKIFENAHIFYRNFGKE